MTTQQLTLALWTPPVRQEEYIEQLANPSTVERSYVNKEIFSKGGKKTILFSIRAKTIKRSKGNLWHTRCSLYQKNTGVVEEKRMEEMDIRQQFHLLQKEIESAGSRTEDLRLQLIAAIDALKIEVEVLRRFMERHHQDFSRHYGELREAVVQQFDPEWMERARQEKTPRPKERK